ncbi:hypothetical protein BhaS171_00002 [Bacillus phage vB_BhaS-171]|uniref:HNH endonuclease n=1 Tax=Bacillus phage vB_BhaS-171 TaxID=1775140 RepID=UPI000744AC92|nr:HNH endonuclease [Bacillus phage vB_BhaS-171]ALY08058.1 hypothetical protein BhaS171_00002 [Bacillus phage vB_BhaS-171]
MNNNNTWKHRVKDIRGVKFGKLTPIDYVEYKDRMSWECRCECGNIRHVRNDDLTRNKVVSCGCYRDERNRTANLQHGLGSKKVRDSIYHAWDSMKRRCLTKSNINFHYYGGRGIRICDEWMEYIPFREWSLNNGYKENLTLDRIDPNGNYEPSNCRWTDRTTQSYNRNIQSNNTSGKTGVVWVPMSSKWKAEIKKHGRVYRLGHYDSFDDAVKARKCGELKHYGYHVNQ